MKEEYLSEEVVDLERVVGLELNSSGKAKSGTIDGEQLLESYIGFCNKYKKKRIPQNLHLDLQLSGDLALDSIDQVEFLLHVEKTFGLSIDPDKSTNVRTFRDLLELINENQDADAKGGVPGVGITDLQRHLIEEVPQFYNEVDEQHGRTLKIKGKEVYDFASANYLGLDLDERIFAKIEEDLRKWGTHPSWSRAIASPELYTKLENTLSHVVGAPRVLVFPTVTLIHMGILPLVATPDTLFLMDERAHKSIQEGVDLAYAKGALKKFFKHNDLEDLQRELENARELDAVYICIDGVYSMTGVDAKLPEMIEMIRDYPNATIYVDDAHGFGLWGSNPSEENPYGTGGGGLLRKYNIDVNRDKVIYVAGLSKAFSSLGAFVTCRSDAELEMFATAATFINSGPCPTASLSSAQTGLEISQSSEGDEIRRYIFELTKRFVTGVREVGLVAESSDFYPLVSVEIGTIAAVTEAAKILWEKGILITPAVYPNAPIKRSMLRFTITAANTIEEIDNAINALEIVRDLVPSAPYYY
ncbi:aminotransferase class I/II-fold pyridoxal phosphate-dependent enzyme [Pseudoalteromonas fuliginea]|nr:aminotransferase class I/II-fold pyridoxal phosphate-dependent enzyme [Pseudoalteromonas fuliginea]